MIAHPCGECWPGIWDIVVALETGKSVKNKHDSMQLPVKQKDRIGKRYAPYTLCVEEIPEARRIGERLRDGHKEVLDMKRMMLISAAILMGAALVLGSGQAFAGSGAGFEKLDYGDDLYGLPNIVTPSMGAARTWDKLNYGDDLYGLPSIASPSMSVPGMWDKLDLGDDSRGLATLPKTHS